MKQKKQIVTHLLFFSHTKIILIGTYHYPDRTVHPDCK